MIACFDVHYEKDLAIAAAIVFNHWSDESIVDHFVVRCKSGGRYQAGSFYQRELGPLLEVIRQFEEPIHTYVIDAYCHLSADGSPGLGARLHQELSNEIQVIGVAKNRFRDTSHAIEVLRGESDRPLFVSSIGIDYQAAANHIQSMSGEHRIPNLLKSVDRLARSGKIEDR